MVFTRTVCGGQSDRVVVDLGGEVFSDSKTHLIITFSMQNTVQLSPAPANQYTMARILFLLASFEKSITSYRKESNFIWPPSKRRQNPLEREKKIISFFLLFKFSFA